MPSVVHVTDQFANNRAEVSHQPTRQRERQMRHFKSAAQVQRFAAVRGVVQNSSEWADESRLSSPTFVTRVRRGPQRPPGQRDSSLEVAVVCLCH